MKKHLFCCLAWVLSVMFCFPLQSVAGGENDVIAFSTFEELCGYCARDMDFTEGSFYCEEEDLIISGDLEIPSGMSVTFRSFTVPEGITLTVLENARIMAYAFTIKGELINRGTVFQGDLTEGEEDTDIKIMALVPGHIRNKGEMTLTDVYGKRNILWIGSQFTMLETVNYGKELFTGSKDQKTQPTALPEMETSPKPDTPREGRGRILEIFDLLEVYLPRMAFFMVILLLGVVVRSALIEKKEEKDAGRSSYASKTRHGGKAGGRDSFRRQSTDIPYDTYVEDHFQRDRRNRISQLDDWLKNGLIDRKEYDELKKRYKQE